MGNNRLIFILFTFSLILFLLDSVHLLNGIKKNLDPFIIPIKQSIFDAERNSISLVQTISHISSYKKDSQRLKELEQESEELKMSVRALTSENEALRAQLNAPLAHSYHYIPASVLGISRFLEINAGENDSVKVGMTVVSQSTLVGKIATVSTYRSAVMLTSDNEISIPVKTSRGTHGVITGFDNQSISLTNVLQKEPLFLDDQVVTTGESGFAPNLLIGKVTHIVSDDAQVYKSAKVDQVIQIRELQTVFIISSL